LTISKRCFLPRELLPSCLSFSGIFYLLFIFFPLQVLAAECNDSSIHSPSEILTLSDTACLLKVSPAEIANLAKRGDLPGQRIGKKWRFGRRAVLKWLTRENSPSLKPRHLEEVVSDPPLSRISGKGLSASTQDTAGESDLASSETLGEAPDLGTAEDIFLRDQILLKVYDLTLELGMSYTKSEQEGLTIINVGSPTSSDLLSISSEGDTEVFATSLNLRLGLPHDMQLFASAPYSYQQSTARTPETVISTPNESTTSQAEIGDVSFGLRKTLLKSKKHYPDIIVSLQSQIPTHSSGYGLGSGFSLVKRIDPVVLFASLNYLHIFNQSVDNPSRLQADNIFNGAFGYALSLNETLAISISASGTFTSKSTFGSSNNKQKQITHTGQERFNLNLGLTALLTERLYIEPNLSFSLTGPSVVTLSLSLPYTFDLSTLFSS